jgi:hypothetical protein
VLELGKSGSHGLARGTLPVLRDGALVAELRASNWKESATAVIASREWVLGKHKRELTGRWASEPEDAVRLRARQVSMWRSTWVVDLEGTPLEVQSRSMWKGTHRYLAAGRVVAESGTTGGWSPRPTLTTDEAMPLDHQVFLLWVELVISRRNQAATTAAIAGGAAAAGSS